MNRSQIDKLNLEIHARMAKDIESKIRDWIDKSGDEKLKALKATVEVNENKVRALTAVGAQLVLATKTFYNQAVIDKQTLTEEQKFDLCETIDLASRVFPQPTEEKIIEPREKPRILSP